MLIPWSWSFEKLILWATESWLHAKLIWDLVGVDLVILDSSDNQQKTMVANDDFREIIWHNQTFTSFTDIYVYIQRPTSNVTWLAITWQISSDTLWAGPWWQWWWVDELLMEKKKDHRVCACACASAYCIVCVHHTGRCCRASQWINGGQSVSLVVHTMDGPCATGSCRLV